MSFFSNFFSSEPDHPVWDASICKKNISLAIFRLRLQSSKKQGQSVQAKRDIAALLAEGKEVSAKSHTEMLIREEARIDAFSKLEIFCEQLQLRADHITKNTQIPDDVIECVSTIVFAAPRVDIAELKKIAQLLEAKYGPRWAEACHANSLKTVNPSIFEDLSLGRIESSKLEEYMIQIAKQHDLSWKPITSSATTHTQSKLQSSSKLLESTTSNAASRITQTPSAPPQEPATSPGHTPNLSHSTSPPSSKQHSSPTGNSAILHKTPPDLAAARTDMNLILQFPAIPNNTDISMEHIPVALEGGVIVSHEEDDRQTVGIDDTLPDSAFLDIPDEPYFGDPTNQAATSASTQQYDEHRFQPIPSVHSEKTVPAASDSSDMSPDDALLARFNKLKSL